MGILIFVNNFDIFKMGTPPQEAEENTGMQRYYLITFLMFSSLSGYCASFYSAYNSQTCIAND